MPHAITYFLRNVTLTRRTLLPSRNPHQVSARGAVSPLHYDAAGSFLAQVTPGDIGEI